MKDFLLFYNFYNFFKRNYSNKEFAFTELNRSLFSESGVFLKKKEFEGSSLDGLNPST